MEIKLNVKETKKLLVGKHGTGLGGRIYLPKHWVGEKVVVCLLEDE